MKKERYLQIFNYLLEFSKLRSNPVRDIEYSETQYPEIIWLSDIPNNELFESITFQDFDKDSDYYIKIRKPKDEPSEPKFPKVPDNLSDWILEESLIDEENLPKLKESIIKDEKTFLLLDFPTIEKEFQEYVSSKWLDDIEKYKNDCKIFETKRAEYNKLSETYKRFFSMYNKAKQFGEEYELIIGIGLLKFKENDDTPLISRHVFTSRMEIDFPENESCITVSPNVESDIKLETDFIIDLLEQFNSGSIIDAETKCHDYINDKNILSIFEDNIKSALQIFADRLRSDSLFKDIVERPKEIPKKPTLVFAPALILRKRNTRSFTALYNNIIKDISESDEDIDISTINDLVGFYEDEKIHAEVIDNESTDFSTDDIIYFPKKYNNEQIEIANKANRSNKVLVQGPPGTGKSHTIANLICHLLANGKKILVTAYTKRALEVLKGQLPEEFKSLSVNLLSGDSASIKDLDSSVNRINEKLSNANISDYKKEIGELDVELEVIEEDVATTQNELIRIKEKSSRIQNINKYYQGTLLEIAEKIEKESLLFKWYRDNFCDIDRLEVIDDFQNFLSLFDIYKTINIEELELDIPSKDKILNKSELSRYVDIGKELSDKYSSRKYGLTITCSEYEELKDHLEKLLQTSIQVEHNASPYKEEIISGDPSIFSTWQDKLRRTEELLLELPENKLRELDRNVEVSYPRGIALLQLKNDAETLLRFAKDGNSLSGILFNVKKMFFPRDIKEKLYFINSVRINGSPCDTLNELERVLNDIKIRQDFKDLKELFNQENINVIKSHYEKIKVYKDLYNDLESLLNLLWDFNDDKLKIQELSSIVIEGISSQYLKKKIEEVDFNSLVNESNILKGKIQTAIGYLSSSKRHPIAQILINDIRTVNSSSFEHHLSEIEALTNKKEEYLKFKVLQSNLKQCFPLMMTEVIEGTFEFSNINNLEKAIYLNHASKQISQLFDEGYENVLDRKMQDLETKQDNMIAKLASKKAWLKVLERLSNDHLLHKHLQAWVAAVKKIGKTGRGKRALKFRKIAQNEMEHCKGSVPCWVMPLYKVAETIKPQMGMYDYVIIDEASQIGPDAIFLLYISKHIIIVGDDKQVSPEYVGVDANTMAPHIARHLKGIPFSDFYGTEFSFFDHAKMFCNGTQTVLREHFRCMPEIIEFSNRYFYAPEGKSLYPLKQYNENRLEPLRHVFIENGYVDGQYQNIINKPEAESIANTISDLVTDKKYDGKSFGVINLQGNRQGSLIESLLLEKIGETEYHNRKIVCGNSASFQGDERDVIFLSLVTAQNHNRAALVKPEDERRFNVAASRAKEQMWLFHSVQLDDLSNTNDLRYKLIDHFINYKERAVPLMKPIERQIGTQPDPFESWFEVDVFNDIVSRGYSVIPQYKVAGGKYRIDLVALMGNGMKIAIECDGDKFHSSEQFQNDIMRQKVLERCGWRFFRIRGFEYYSNRIKALESLWKILESYQVNKYN
jgi:superfamily I DNA and/or RNA helicase/very-short-patch-repair endonuclease